MEPTKESDEAGIKLLEAMQSSYENGCKYGEKDLAYRIIKAYNDSTQQMKAYEIIDLILKIVK